MLLGNQFAEASEANSEAAQRFGFGPDSVARLNDHLRFTEEIRQVDGTYPGVDRAKAHIARLIPHLDAIMRTIAGLGLNGTRAIAATPLASEVKAPLNERDRELERLISEDADEQFEQLTEQEVQALTDPATALETAQHLAKKPSKNAEKIELLLREHSPPLYRDLVEAEEAAVRFLDRVYRAVADLEEVAQYMMAPTKKEARGRRPTPRALTFAVEMLVLEWNGCHLRPANLSRKRGAFRDLAHEILTHPFWGYSKQQVDTAMKVVLLERRSWSSAREQKASGPD